MEGKRKRGKKRKRTITNVQIHTWILKTNGQVGEELLGDLSYQQTNIS